MRETPIALSFEREKRLVGLASNIGKKWTFIEDQLRDFCLTIVLTGP